MAKRYALVIGNSEYDDASLARLKAPDADVRQLAAILADSNVGGFDEVTQLVNQPVTVMRRAISNLYAGKGPEDLLLLYFSGHGVKDENGLLYLAVKDTEREWLRATAIPAGFISEEMDQSRSRRQLLILDCCHSGSFAPGAKGAVKESVGTATSFRGSGFGRVVLTATDATQYAWEGDKVVGQADNSVFTYWLIEGLKTGQADRNADGWISLDELYDYVYEQVLKMTPRQTPGKWSFKQQGDIILARSTGQVVKLPKDVEDAVHNPLASVRKAVVPDLVHLVRHSPLGTKLAAYAALQALADDDSRQVSSAASEAIGTCQPLMEIIAEDRAGLEHRLPETSESPADLAPPGISLPAAEVLPAERGSTAAGSSTAAGRVPAASSAGAPGARLPARSGEHPPGSGPAAPGQPEAAQARPAAHPLPGLLLNRRSALMLSLAALAVFLTAGGIALSLWIVPAILTGLSGPVASGEATHTPAGSTQRAGVLDPTATPAAQDTPAPSRQLTVAALRDAWQTATRSAFVKTDVARAEKNLESTRQAGLTRTAAAVKNREATRRAEQTSAAYLALLEEARRWPLETLDTFDNNKNQWYVGFNNDTWASDTTVLKEGKYQRDFKAHKSMISRAWVLLSPTNFYASVDIEVREKQIADSRSQPSLILRSSSDGYYMFGLSMSGQYSFQKFVAADGGWTRIVDYAPAPDFQAGGPNTLAVIAQGDRFTLFINGHFVAQAVDDSLPTGKLGLGASLYSKDDQALFLYDNFELRAP